VPDNPTDPWSQVEALMKTVGEYLRQTMFEPGIDKEVVEMIFAEMLRGWIGRIPSMGDTVSIPAPTAEHYNRY
jgi:hypothetical protein